MAYPPTIAASPSTSRTTLIVENFSDWCDTAGWAALFVRVLMAGKLMVLPESFKHAAGHRPRAGQAVPVPRAARPSTRAHRAARCRADAACARDRAAGARRRAQSQAVL